MGLGEMLIIATNNPQKIKMSQAICTLHRIDVSGHEQTLDIFLHMNTYNNYYYYYYYYYYYDYHHYYYNCCYDYYCYYYDYDH